MYCQRAKMLFKISDFSAENVQYFYCFSVFFFLLPVISHTCTIVPCKCLWCVITRFAFHSLFLLYNCTLHCYTYILHYHTYLQCLHFYSEGFFLHPLKYRLFRKLYLRLPCVFLAFCYFFLYFITLLFLLRFFFCYFIFFLLYYYVPHNSIYLFISWLFFIFSLLYLFIFSMFYLFPQFYCCYIIQTPIQVKCILLLL